MLFWTRRPKERFSRNNCERDDADAGGRSKLGAENRTGWFYRCGIGSCKESQNEMQNSQEFQGRPPAGDRTVKRLIRLSKKALTIPDIATVADACPRMATRRVDAALFTDSNAIIYGIITDKDVAMRVVAEGLKPEETDLSKTLQSVCMMPLHTWSVRLTRAVLLLLPAAVIQGVEQSVQNDVGRCRLYSRYGPSSSHLLLQLLRAATVALSDTVLTATKKLKEQQMKGWTSHCLMHCTPCTMANSFIFLLWIKVRSSESGEMTGVMFQKFWDSALALEAPETDDDSHRLLYLLSDATFWHS
ncbi:unnamed protein product [Sphagnum balticum]